MFQQGVPPYSAQGASRVNADVGRNIMRTLFAAIVLFTAFAYADSDLSTNSISGDPAPCLTAVDLLMPKLIITQDPCRMSPVTIVEVNASGGLYIDHDNNYSTYSNLTLSIYQCDSIISQIDDNGRATIRPINAFRITTPLFPDKLKRFSRTPGWTKDYSWSDLSNAHVIDFNGKRYGAYDFAKQHPIIGDCNKTSQQGVPGYRRQSAPQPEP